MVAAEERKMKVRKDAVKEEESSRTSSQSKGKENKHKIVSEHKAAGKPERPDAAEHEAKNIQRQNEKYADARKEAVVDDAKVKDRGEWSN